MERRCAESVLLLNLLAEHPTDVTWTDAAKLVAVVVQKAARVAGIAEDAAPHHDEGDHHLVAPPVPDHVHRFVIEALGTELRMEMRNDQVLTDVMYVMDLAIDRARVVVAPGVDRHHQ